MAEECDPFAVSAVTSEAGPTTAAGFKTAQELRESIDESAEVMLVGDSIFRLWPDVQSAFHGRRGSNFSVGGDRLQNVLWRLRSTDFGGLSPKMIAILAGTNNLVDGGMPGCAIARGVEAILKEVKGQWPDAVVFVVGITPRGPDFKQFNAASLQCGDLSFS